MGLIEWLRVKLIVGVQAPQQKQEEHPENRTYTDTGYFQDLRDTFYTWYYHSRGVSNLRKLIAENEYRDTTHEPRSKYQIDRYERWRISTGILCALFGMPAAYNGYKLATEQFNKVNEMTIYESRTSQWRVRSNFRWMGALGYSFPVMIRTFTFTTFLLGVPALLGVYRDDTDYVSHYVGSSGVGAIVVSLMTTSKEFKGVRPKVMAVILGMIPGLFAGVSSTLAQKHDIYPLYDRYQERWRIIDPLWADFVEKQDESEKSLHSEKYNGTLDKVEESLQGKENDGILDKVKELQQGEEDIGISDEVEKSVPLVSCDVNDAVSEVAPVDAER